MIARRVHEHWWSLTRAQARVALDEALDNAEASGEPNAIAHVLHIRHLALWDHDDLVGRIASASRIVDLRNSIEGELVLEGYSWLMADELERGNIHGFEAARTAHKELAQHLRLSDQIGSAYIRCAARDLLKGRLREVVAACEQPSQEASAVFHVLWLAFLRYSLHRERDTVTEVLDQVRGLALAAEAWPAMKYWLACTLATAGTADAGIAFGGICANDFRDLPDDLSRLMLLGFCAEACTIVGTTGSAHLLYAQLLPFAGRHLQFGNGTLYFDSVSHMLARLAAQLERWDTADQHFSDALRQAQALGAGPRSAHIQFHWAVMLVNSGRADEIPRALTLLNSAVTAARHFDLSGLIPKILAQQKQLGGEQSTTAPAEAAPVARPSTEPSPATADADGSRYVFRCEGDFWSLQFGSETLRLKDSRGLQLIAALLRYPGTHLHSLELAAGSESRAFAKSSAGGMLDAKARDAYRKRLRELTLEQAEAEAHNDPPRMARARHESELLTQQLAAALGIGGRTRRAAAEAERARVNVTRSIRSAISRMATRSPGLAHHLDTSIRTGAFCTYVPDPSRKIDWEL